MIDSDVFIYQRVSSNVTFWFHHLGEPALHDWLAHVTWSYGVMGLSTHMDTMVVNMCGVLDISSIYVHTFLFSSFRQFLYRFNSLTADEHFRR